MKARLDVSRAIDSGLSYLRGRQRASGAFTVYKSTDPDLLQDCVDDLTPFPAALIAYSLSFCSLEDANVIRAKIGRYLLDEMYGPGLWRYWSAQHAWYLNIPPDLDDMACNSIALSGLSLPFPDNRKIILANRDRRGRFFTWLIPRLQPTFSLQYWRVTVGQLLRIVRYVIFWIETASRPSDVDGVVNANVLFYLKSESSLEAVVDFLVSILRDHGETTCDRWYQNEYAFYYSLSRNFGTGIERLDSWKSEVLRRLRRTRLNRTNPLEVALVACAMMNCDADSATLSPFISLLIDSQNSTGEWPAKRLYTGGIAGYGWGSEELTSGFCLEALVRFSALVTQT